jgi:hypothetical protein
VLSFRYHVVSLVAVFLALSIGVVVGSAVIDRALVDRLEDQQQILRDDIAQVREANRQLAAELEAEREQVQRLDEEGSERLVAGALEEVSVLAVVAEGVPAEATSGLVDAVEAAGADRRGSLVLTSRLDLAADGDATDLAAVLGEPATLPQAVLRNLALDRLARELRVAVDPALGTEAAGLEGEGTGFPALVGALTDAGFLEVARTEGASAAAPLALPGTRIVVVGGPGAEVAGEALAGRFVRELVTEPGVAAAAGVVAVEVVAPADDEGEPPDPFVARVRDAEDLAGRAATVDNLDQLAGRLATVLALQDLGEGITGHYGVADGAERLLPAPTAGTGPEG